jgi:hypothetical protein
LIKPERPQSTKKNNVSPGFLLFLIALLMFGGLASRKWPPEFPAGIYADMWLEHGRETLYDAELLTRAGLPGSKRR